MVVLLRAGHNGRVLAWCSGESVMPTDSARRGWLYAFRAGDRDRNREGDAVTAVGVSYV